ncbi:MAG: alpha/beta fold hydrolase [Xanthomonadales bacterium PRO7]|nr:alpha/beta fold hydrolase [Xanthomonadales bacterium PRO7]HMM57126.1 alpha/beta fold hydrolase [Rudaea sp.]
MNDHVILLHGLWMRGFTLAALRHRLEAAGFSVDLFDYASVLRGPEIGVANLIEKTRSHKGGKVHFVGHSLGGLVALQALQRAPEITRGRVVCLGSPLRGSAVARTVAQFPGGSLVIGKSLDVLTSGVERWEGKQAVGAIAGRLPIGFGFAFGALASPHDGTVSVAETELPGLTDHVVVPATHTGLLFSQDAAAQTIAFLRTARFSQRV